MNPKRKLKKRHDLFLPFWIHLIFLTFFTPVVGQNLLPDGGFEIELNTGCNTPEQGFHKLQHWYLLDATPDLFEHNCPFDEAGFVFWDESTPPLEGNNYAGLWSRWNSNSTYFTEGIATQLSEPLEAGTFYIFDMYILYKGTFQGLVSNDNGCSLDPDRHIDLYLSTDSIQVINDFSNGTASTTADMVAILGAEIIEGANDTEWRQVSACFQANGGENFFGIIMPLGTFGELPPCAETNIGSGIFKSFYYNLDALSLRELKTVQENTITVCADQDYEVDLFDLYELPVSEPVIFTWDDGFQGSTRRLSESGNFEIEAAISCENIQLSLNTQTESCAVNLYLPNAFSPNFDGINDAFELFLPEGIIPENYSMKIYDRWGGLVFASNDHTEKWDGTKNGKALTQGIFTWVIQFEITTLEGTSQEIETGTVLLVK